MLRKDGNESIYKPQDNMPAIKADSKRYNYNGKWYEMSFHPAISKEEAEQLLNHLHPAQRGRRDHHVDVFSTEIAENRFTVSPDPIVIFVNDKTGEETVGNGQHRLGAVVETGSPQPFFILRTNDLDIYNIIDNQMPRKLGDHIRSFMKGNTQYAILVGSIAKMTLDYLEGHLQYKMRTNASSEGRAFEWAKENLPTLIDVAKTTDNIIKTALNQSEEFRKVVPPRLAGTFLYLARREGKAAKNNPETFLSQLYSGVQQNGTLVGSPISTLRDLMAPKVPNYGFRLEAIPRFWSLIKTYNAVRSNTPLKNVRLGEKEELPKFFFEK